MAIRNNPGFLTTKEGTATVPDGASTVTVPHGLGGTPSQVQLTANGLTQVGTSAKGVTNIVIQRSGTAGALNVDWTAIWKA